MNVKPVGGITQVLRVVVIVMIIISVLAIGTEYLSYRDYSSLAYDVPFEDVFFISDLLSFFVRMIGLVVSIVYVVLFFIWIYRLNKNLRTLSDMNMKFTPGWSVGWFFIPFANFFMPYRVVKELWHVCHKDFEVSRAMVRMWWILYLMDSFAAGISSRLSWRANTAGEYATSALTSMFTEVFAILASIAVLALLTRLGTAYAKNYGEESSMMGGDSWALPANL
jgi:hypothetical protein